MEKRVRERPRLFCNLPFPQHQPMFSKEFEASEGWICSWYFGMLPDPTVNDFRFFPGWALAKETHKGNWGYTGCCHPEIFAPPTSSEHCSWAAIFPKLLPLELLPEFSSCKPQSHSWWKGPRRGETQHPPAWDLDSSPPWSLILPGSHSSWNSIPGDTF